MKHTISGSLVGLLSDQNPNIGDIIRRHKLYPATTKPNRTVEAAPLVSYKIFNIANVDVG